MTDFKYQNKPNQEPKVGDRVKLIPSLENIVETGIKHLFIDIENEAVLKFWHDAEPDGTTFELVEPSGDIET